MPRSLSTRGTRLALGLTLAVVALAPTRADTPRPDPDTLPGRDLYQRLCAECHGDRGEGVPGRHEDALDGDWSLERLTRIIERTMPEEDPTRCVGEDAAAVARYVHAAFSAPARQATDVRHPAARIELTRLTARQYLQTVADLLSSRAPETALPETDPGLRGEYFRGQDFNRDNLVEERLDPQVDFDFGLESPNPERIAPGEFSVRWRGSLRAEDTGDHEFILVVENGVRLWINDETEPLIDGWVASAGRQEHRARLRLLGGRDYPLRLEFRKGRERSGVVSLQWIPPHGVQEPIPARQLSPRRAAPTLIVRTPFPADDASVGYERGVAVSRAWDDATTQAAIEVAEHVVHRLDALAGTRPDARNRIETIRAFGRRFVERAFRRPLTAAEQQRYVDTWLDDTASPEAGVRRLVLLALKSPRFLYPGLEAQPPDAYDRATRLAYALWDSGPDDALLKAARTGQLESPEAVRAQAGRLLSDPRARSKIRALLHHWLHVDRLEDLAKDPALFPEFTPRILADLRTSLNLFLDAVVWSEGSDLRELLRADDLFLNERLARFYGLDTPLRAGFERVDVSNQPRSGVLTHPYLLAALAYPRSTSPIHRGVFLTRTILGRPLNPPPAAVAFKEADFDPHLTMREKVAELTRSDACQTCHAVINPLGFTLEHYDAVGRFRTRDGERPVDAAADYPTPAGEVLRLTGAVDVAALAAASPAAQAAFVEQVFHQVVKQPALAYGPDTLDQLRESFVNSGCHIRRLVVEIAVRAALHPTATPDTRS